MSERVQVKFEVAGASVDAEIDRSSTDASEPSSTPPSEEACMTPGQGVIKALLRIINK